MRGSRHPCEQFVDAYDTLIIGAALLYLVPQWKLTPVETGLLAASAS